VAFEFWTQRGVGSGVSPLRRWNHFVYPMTIWQWGDNTFEADAASPTLVGFSRSNGNWGDGPYGDGPPDGEDISDGGYWATNDDPPDAACEAVAVTSTS
jgi:hypothetical protein